LSVFASTQWPNGRLSSNHTGWQSWRCQPPETKRVLVTGGS
jgi:hypothetical protein